MSTRNPSSAIMLPDNDLFNPDAMAELELEGLFMRDPSMSLDSNAMWQGQAARNPTWTDDFTSTGIAGFSPSTQADEDFGSIGLTGFSPSPQAEPVASPVASTHVNIDHLPYQLTIKPLNSKSRVETQIPIALIMHSIPPGTKKLHLQPQTISKPKLLAKESARGLDCLELHASVVCTSAMQKPHLRERAMQRAAGIPETPLKPGSRQSSAGDAEEEEELDPEDPLNGAYVRICPNCINREKKRAARKKSKKQEDEDHWSQFEEDRVVVFNTSEYKDWSPYISKDGLNDGGIPEGAVQVEIPMRIACYCRHQGEKIGFKVIFTVKDHKDRVVAQNMSDSILITDDHKTATPVAGSAGIPVADGYVAGVPVFHDIPQGPFQHRPYHSTNDLQALRANFPQQGYSNMQSSPMASMITHSASTSVTPRNLSRPASPTPQVGPNKKRKGSSVHHRIPPGLSMTSLTSSPGVVIPAASDIGPLTPISAAPLSAGPILGGAEHAFGAMAPLTYTPYQSQPATPNPGYVVPPHRTTSAESVQMYEFYSAPNSAHPSRVPSPVSSSRPPTRGYGQPMAFPSVSEVANQTMPAMSYSPETVPRPRSVITRVNPIEGPMTGNIEIDINGSDFYDGVQVMFGDLPAQTTFCNEGWLIAVLPQSALSGPVEVSLSHPNEMSPFFQAPSSRRTQYFKYVDEREKAMWETIGKILAQEQFGMVDASQALALVKNSGQQIPYRVKM